MTVVNRRLLLSALFSAIALVSPTALSSAAAVASVASPSANDVQEWLRFVPDRMAHYRVPDLSVACIHKGTLQWIQGFGVTKVGGAPVTEETVFQASSIGMSITAVAVLRLVEQGKLNLDVDVSHYLKSWKLPRTRFTEQKKVTLRELLSHTAGATVHGFSGYAAGERVPTVVQVLKGESPAKSPPVTIEFVPGTKFRYAGGNYAIVQQILVDVTGEQFPDLMQELVLRPLHMVHSTFQESIPQNLHADIAMPFDKDGNAIEGGPRNYPEMAGSGLWTNPSDLALFALAIQDPFGGKPGAIMSVSMAREMLQPVAGDYALGFFVDGNGPNRYFWHPGANRGFLAFFFAYEKGDGVVLMSNAQQSKPLMLEVIRALSKQYGWTQFPTASRFSDLRGIGLICVCIAGITYALFLVRRRASNFRSRRDPAM